MTLTQDDLDKAALVIVCDEKGEFRWSSTHSAAEAAIDLRATIGSPALSPAAADQPPKGDNK